MPLAMVVDPDWSTRQVAGHVLAREGFQPLSTTTVSGARAQLAHCMPQLLLPSSNLPDGDALELLTEFARAEPPAVIVLSTECRRRRHWVSDNGVFDCVMKPINPSELQAVIRRMDLSSAAERRGESHDFGPMIGRSVAMRELYAQIGQAAAADAPVLIEGESGTGKELVARTLHQLSARHVRAFVTVRSGAIAAELAESELFGHAAGSSGAPRRHLGYVEEAQGGTLFLDEICELPLLLQARLLDVLQNRAPLRGGVPAPPGVDVRVIAATSRDPDAAVAAGLLRADLLQWLAVMTLRVPPLRAREDDVLLLAHAFSDEMNERYGTVRRMNAPFCDWLMGQAWPGNVRELRNVIERSHTLARGEFLMPLEAAAAAPEPVMSGQALLALLEIPVPSRISDVERQLVIATLRKFGGSKIRTAEALGISLKTLYNKLRSYGL
ncbi:MAG: sigma-54 dependent transcriptional regulator [Steroidobacteraceae bacterium]